MQWKDFHENPYTEVLFIPSKKGFLCWFFYDRQMLADIERLAVIGPFVHRSESRVSCFVFPVVSRVNMDRSLLSSKLSKKKNDLKL